ncbi:33229_t:CDS:2, partial [Racocetra persica]
LKPIDNYTTFDTNTVCDKIKDLLLENLEELDTYSYDEQLDELDNENSKYQSKEFLLKLSIKTEDNITLPAKWSTILADSCNKFHNQILSDIQSQLNNIAITQNDYVLAYKVTKETGVGTQIINESDFESFINDYNQATNKEKEMFINIQIPDESNSNDNNSNKKKPRLFSKKPKESYLDDERHIMASTIAQICKKYFYASCEGSC